MKTEVEDMPPSWTQKSSLQLGHLPHLHSPDPLPWPDHLRRPDFFHRPSADHHRPSALNHHLLAMEQQRPSTINRRLPIMEHQPYNDLHRPITLGHRPPEQRGSIINHHRPLEARQMPNLIDRNEGEDLTSFKIT